MIIIKKFWHNNTQSNKTNSLNMHSALSAEAFIFFQIFDFAFKN